MNTTCPLCGEPALASEVRTESCGTVQLVACPCGDPVLVKDDSDQNLKVFGLGFVRWQTMRQVQAA